MPRPAIPLHAAPIPGFLLAAAPVHAARSMWDTQHDPTTWKLVYLVLVLTAGLAFLGLAVAMVVSAIRARRKMRERRSRRPAPGSDDLNAT